jgi:glycerol-3-phosphate dehydrogenase
MPEDTKSIVRDHVVEVDSRSKLVSILGGKWTTYRVMAKDTIDLVESEVFVISRKKCVTKDYSLFTGVTFDKTSYLQQCEQSNLSDASKAHLEEVYGPEKGEVLNFLLKEKNGTDILLEGLPYMKGEIAYLQQCEMASNINDILDRRWGLSLRDKELSEQIKKVVHF